MRVRNVLLLAFALLALLAAAHAARDDGDEVKEAVEKAAAASDDAEDEVQEVAAAQAEAMVKKAAAKVPEPVDPDVAKAAAIAADAAAGGDEALKRGARDAADRRTAADAEVAQEVLDSDKADEARAVQMDALNAAASKMAEKVEQMGAGSGAAPAPVAADRVPPPVAKVEDFTPAKMRQAEMEIGSVFSGVISSMVTNILTQNPDIVRRALIVKQMKLAADAAAAVPAM